MTEGAKMRLLHIIKFGDCYHSCERYAEVPSKLEQLSMMTPGCTIRVETTCPIRTCEERKKEAINLFLLHFSQEELFETIL